MAETGEITQLLEALRAGERDAFDGLVSFVYQELRQIARNRLRRDRAEFMAASYVAMKQVIIQFARARAAAKRGGGNARPVPLDEKHLVIDSQAERLLELNAALDKILERNERLARVVECRFFAGLSEEDTARALGVSLCTAQRDWLRARAWLQDELSSGGST